MRGSHQCSFEPLLRTTVTLISLMNINILLFHSSFKWHLCCLVMQIPFFLCRRSIKAQPFLPSSTTSSFSLALCWLGTLNVFQVSAPYLRARLWQASCPLGPGSPSTPPPLHLPGSMSSLMYLKWVSSVSYSCHLISETLTVWAHFNIKKKKKNSTCPCVSYFSLKKYVCAFTQASWLSLTQRQGNGSPTLPSHASCSSITLNEPHLGFHLRESK